MPVYRLSRQLVFPPVEGAEDGVVAVGGDLRPERLLLAYAQGIFPWYHDGLPIIWHSPDPRCVLRVEGLNIPRSLRKFLNKRPYTVTLDNRFADVIAACKAAPRPGQEGTWITDDMERAYNELHRRGHAHSVEVWAGKQLVGGLYGVALGRMYFGESMFSHADNASKVGLVGLVHHLRGMGARLIDCQVANAHTLGLGAEEWPRTRYLHELKVELDARPLPPGPWHVEPFAPQP